MTAIQREWPVQGDYAQEKGVLLRVFPVAFALLYAYALVELPLDVFKDRANYFTYIQYSEAIFARYWAQGWLATLANEPIWLLINIQLWRYFYPDTVLKILIFVPAFIVSWQLMRRDPRHAIWLILFLLSPQVVKNHIIHIRQGFGLAIFITGYFAGPRCLRLSLMTVACFIHASFFFLAVILLAIWTSRQMNLPTKAKVAIFILCSIAIGAMIGAVAGGVGARQAVTYSDADLDITGLGFLFWLIIFFVFASAGEEFIRRNLFGFFCLAFYLVIYFIHPVSGRIFESGMFAVFLTGLALPIDRRVLFLGAYFVFAAAQYVFRWEEPWLGFGII